MTEFAADVVVTLKPVVNDPQGLSVTAGLRSLGFTEVSSARVGKLVELVLDAADEAVARHRVVEMCEKLLCNPVIEDWRIDSLRPHLPAAPVAEEQGAVRGSLRSPAELAEPASEVAPSAEPASEVAP